MSVERRQDEIRDLREQAHRRAAAGWQRPSDLPDSPLQQISYWLEHERLTNAEIVDAIDAARADGAKWWEIGTAMERTSEGARAFYQYNRKDVET